MTPRLPHGRAAGVREKCSEGCGCSVTGSSHVLFALPFPERMEAGDEPTPGWPQTTRSLWVAYFGHGRGGPGGTKGQLLWVGGPHQTDSQRQARATFGTDADHRPRGQQNVSTWGPAWFAWPRHPPTLTLAHSPSSMQFRLTATRLSKIWPRRHQAILPWRSRSWLAGGSICTGV